MKYQKVKALIVGFVFSVSSMTACGAYGAVESPYGDVAAVYGAFEPMETESDMEETEHKEEYNGFDPENNQPLEFHGIIFDVPSYLNPEESTEDVVTYNTVDQETESSDPALLIFRYGTMSEWYPQWDAEDPNADNPVDLVIDRLSEEELADTDASWMDFYGYTSAAVNGEGIDIYAVNVGDEEVCYYTVIFFGDKDEFCVVGLKSYADNQYSYFTDYKQIVESAQVP